MNFIKKLQNKSRLVRIQILWTSVILVMILIFFVWLSLLKSSFFDQKNLNQEQEQKIKPAISLFGTLKGDFSILKRALQSTAKEMIENDEEEIGFEVKIIK